MLRNKLLAIRNRWYKLLDLQSDLLDERSETVNAAIKQKFGAFVRSRLWWKQFRELVIKCVVHNVERGLDISQKECECPEC